MNPKPTLVALGFLAMTLLAMAPTASAGGAGADVIISPAPAIGCATVPRSITVASGLTLNVRSDCGVEAHYDSRLYLCATQPRTLTAGLVSVQVTSTCGLIVVAHL
jgi:hypothetical protein